MLTPAFSDRVPTSCSPAAASATRCSRTGVAEQGERPGGDVELVAGRLGRHPRIVPAAARGRLSRPETVVTSLRYLRE